MKRWLEATIMFPAYETLVKALVSLPPAAPTQTDNKIKQLIQKNYKGFPSHYIIKAIGEATKVLNEDLEFPNLCSSVNHHD